MAVVVHDEEYSLQVQQVCPALRRSLGDVVASFEDAGQPILQAIDDGITTAYG